MSAYPTEDDPILTIYPQRQYHHNAYVIGNRIGLEKLREAINEALNSGTAGEFLGIGCDVVIPCDQEEYTVAVILTDENNDDTAYHDLDPVNERGNSLIPNERYIMAVGAYWERNKDKIAKIRDERENR